MLRAVACNWSSGRYRNWRTQSLRRSSPRRCLHGARCARGQYFPQVCRTLHPLFVALRECGDRESTCRTRKSSRSPLALRMRVIVHIHRRPHLKVAILVHHELEMMILEHLRLAAAVFQQYTIARLDNRWDGNFEGRISGIKKFRIVARSVLVVRVKSNDLFWDDGSRRSNIDYRCGTICGNARRVNIGSSLGR